LTVDVDEVQRWVDQHWDPSITVREWWRRLFEAGYSYPTWPAGLGGRGTSAADARAIHAVLARNRVVGPPKGQVAAALAAPTILEHGTATQVEQFLPAIARGEAAWCQLFSEPGAGSDLASLAARAVREGDEWVVSGQKVWNSGADCSQFGLLLARTDPDAPKRRGITYFLLDMDQPGVEVRPLRQMNGATNFCEVFLDSARVGAGRVLGALDGGWAVAQTTLRHERSSVAGGGTAGLVPARSGETDGDQDVLDVLVGVIVERAREAAGRGGISTGAIRAPMMIDLARRYGRQADPVVRQRLAGYHSQVKVNGWLNRRIGAAGGRLTGADGSLAKMTTSRICQESRDLSFDLLGVDALLAGADAPMEGDVVRVGLASPGTRIGGGTDEIQLNVIGERALGLPREPGDDRELQESRLRPRSPSM
jgi:alkylation response protein AidB-like acyl-CoA dehydrogenase